MTHAGPAPLVFTGHSNVEAESKRACVQAPPAYKEVEIGAHHIVMMYLEKYMSLVLKSYESIFNIFKVVPEYKKMLNVKVNPQSSIFNLQSAALPRSVHCTLGLVDSIYAQYLTRSCSLHKLNSYTYGGHVSRCLMLQQMSATTWVPAQEEGKTQTIHVRGSSRTTVTEHPT
jgi:hypothetical protein